MIPSSLIISNKKILFPMKEESHKQLWEKIGISWQQKLTKESAFVIGKLPKNWSVENIVCYVYEEEKPRSYTIFTFNENKLPKIEFIVTRHFETNYKVSDITVDVKEITSKEAKTYSLPRM